MKLTGAEIVCESLLKEGVDLLFGIPGGAVLPFYDALGKYPQLRHILVRHEQAASMAADGYARASGKVGVCTATSGPGATNLATGIAAAQMDSVPLVAITGQVPRPAIGRDSFQETDLTGLTLPITKHNYLVMDVHDLIEHILSSRGKRVRPALTLLAASCHGANPEWAVTMASAIELLHIATLVHDDTVDESETRRGKATVSNIWGKNIAVLFGDYVFATSATWVCKTQNMRIIRRFSETIMELASGQMSEFFSAYGGSRTRSEYEDRIYRKTASLFCTAGETGAILGGAPESSIQCLKAYGYNLGMAFQIMDDVLDFDGDAKRLGKPIGSDLLNGVLTLPGILLLERYAEDNPISKLFEDPTDTDQFNNAVDLVHSSGVLKDCYEMIRDYCFRAKECLNDIPDGATKTSLLLLTDYIWERSR